ncbi:MAG: TldD/PmbA family protein [Actinomycetota bacterium]
MPDVIGPEDVRTVAEAALDLPGADGVELLFMHEWGGLTRFADSYIHQSTSREDTGIRVRAVSEGRVGVAATNDFSKEGARAAAANALDMAKVAAPDPSFPGLAPPDEVYDGGRFDDATAAVTPTERAEAVAALIGQVGAGFHAAGALETNAVEVAVANTEGQFCYSPSTQSTVTTVVSGGDGGAGAAEVAASRFEEIDAPAVGARAFDKARRSQRLQDLPPGRYDVVLEPLAVTTLVSFLAYVGFGGRAIAEGRSPFSGREGQQVSADDITIYDDAVSSLTIGMPFDFEGTPRRRVVLIENGVFRTGVHDRRSARLAGVESTGHALPPPNPEGPFPLNLFLEPGAATVEEMIRSTERGLLVTRFHYSNIVNPMETSITGMTRDGTWLIEDGRVAHAVKNLRFTQSILEALSNVRSIGRDSELASELFFAASRVPALYISGFNFSGASDH